MASTPVGEAAGERDLDLERTPAMLSARPRRGATHGVLHRTQTARYNTAVFAFFAQQAALEIGASDFETYADAAEQLLEAELELSPAPADQLAALARFAEFGLDCERRLQARLPFDCEGRAHRAMPVARRLRCAGAIRLLEARRRFPGLQPTSVDGPRQKSATAPAVETPNADSEAGDLGADVPPFDQLKPPAVLTAQLRAAPTDGDQLRRLQVECYNAALGELQANERSLASGTIALSSLLDSARRVGLADLELSHDRAEQIAALE